MQVNIKDTQVFQTTLKSLNDLQVRVKDKVNIIFNQLQKKQDEINQELNISTNFLNLARAKEMQKQAILIQKSAELAKALQAEAAALASKNPVAIATATAYVAKKTHEEMIAKKEFQEARQNRINMERRVELVKKAKCQIDRLYEETQNQLNNTQTRIISLTQIINNRLTKSDLIQKNYLVEETKIDTVIINEVKYKNIPQSGGSWSGEPGNSKWKPNRDEIPKQPDGNQKSWGEILDKYDIDGIEFKEGEPNFTPVAKENVEIGDFTTQRIDNFAQADAKLAQQWNEEKRDGKDNWTADDIKKYRKEEKLTWHERSDMKNLDLVPREIHSNIPHKGGISKKKELEEEKENV